LVSMGISSMLSGDVGCADKRPLLEHAAVLAHGDRG
jgi:hypothetical protein